MKEVVSRPADVLNQQPGFGLGLGYPGGTQPFDRVLIDLPDLHEKLR